MKYNELEGARQAAKILWSSVSHHVFVETFTLEMSTAACAVCAALSNVGWQNTLASSVRKKKKKSLSLHSFEFEQTRVSAMVIQIS